jgi:hypothetical protein
MSDLAKARKKVQEGADWRGTIRVTIDDEEHELTVRQLKDPEFFEVMSLIDREELENLRSDLPEGKMERYRELASEEELDEDEEAELEELEEELRGATSSMFDALSQETFEGIRRCAKYAVEPDEEDLRELFVDEASRIEKEYGIKVEKPEDVRPAAQDAIDELIDNAVDFVSFTIGIQALVETVGDEGN